MARRGRDARPEAKRGSSEREAHWRQVMAAWSASGLSKVGFCRERGLSVSAFHWWKGELARRDAARGSRSSRPSSAKAQEAKAKPGFVAVRLGRGSALGAAQPLRADGDDRAGVEVVLGNGRRVRVGPSFDEELLAQVVRVLEGMPW